MKIKRERYRAREAQRVTDLLAGVVVWEETMREGPPVLIDAAEHERRWTIGYYTNDGRWYVTRWYLEPYGPGVDSGPPLWRLFCRTVDGWEHVASQAADPTPLMKWTLTEGRERWRGRVL